MLLFQKRFHEGLVRGDVRLTFRRWDKPHVKPKGRYRCHPIGVLEVDAVARVRVDAITEADAVLAGFTTLAELLAYMTSAKDAPLESTTEVFRVELRHGGDGDRVELALVDDLDADAIREITEKLRKMDADGPWTKKTLDLIGKHPRVAASQLAAKVGRDTASFKVDVRRLKKLGLTQSFEVGYEISPRGRAYLESKKRPRTASRANA